MLGVQRMHRVMEGAEKASCSFVLQNDLQAWNNKPSHIRSRSYGMLTARFRSTQMSRRNARQRKAFPQQWLPDLHCS
jgi:hypothetical protein